MAHMSPIHWSLVAGSLVGVTALITSLDQITHTWGAIERAYAADARSSENRDGILKQETINETLVDILQQRTRRLEPIERFWDDEESWYFCDDGRTIWRADRHGQCQ